MKSLGLLAIALAAATIIAMPARAQDQDQQAAQDQQTAPDPQKAQEQKGATYRFRTEDAGKLKEHYTEAGKVDTLHRAKVAQGGMLPGDWKSRIQPVPEAAMRDLLAPPEGYQFGFIDGYCVVYNPVDGTIAGVVDLTK